MDRFVAAVRRLFGKKEHGDSQENHNHNEKAQNNVQKVERKPHPYDEVTVDDDGANIEVNEPNEFQKAPQRAPRSYEEVELPTNNSDQNCGCFGNSNSTTVILTDGPFAYSKSIPASLTKISMEIDGNIRIVKEAK